MEELLIIEEFRFDSLRPLHDLDSSLIAVASEFWHFQIHFLGNDVSFLEDFCLTLLLPSDMSPQVWDTLRIVKAERVSHNCWNWGGCTEW